MFAELWEKDHLSKCKREEMETAMQLERNREMLRVCTYIHTYICIVYIDRNIHTYTHTYTDIRTYIHTYRY